MKHLTYALLGVAVLLMAGAMLVQQHSGTQKRPPLPKQERAQPHLLRDSPYPPG
jgi:hypothetical protein